MHATKPSMSDPEVTGTYGDLTITYRRTDGHQTFTVTVYQRTLRIPELCQTFTTAHAAWAEAQRVATAAFAGTPVAQIIADRPSQLVLAAVRGITGDGEWQRRTITDTVPAQPTCRVRPTMAGAHLTALTAAQRYALTRHRDGTVYPDGRVTRATLRALDRKGYGTVRYAGTRRRVVALDLNGRGLAEAAKAVAW